MKGKLIVIEGTDGSGKATQTALLVERLKKEGKKIEVFDFPQYGNWSAVFVEKYLRGEFGSAEEVNAQTASLFYALDRYAASFRLKKLLNEGYTIVSNRYTTTNMGHQAGKIKNHTEREKFLKWLDQTEFELLGIPKPDLVIFLHVAPEIGQKLVESKGHRDYIGNKKDIHEASLQHLTDSERAYLEVAEKFSWKKIECVKNGKLLSKEEISECVWKIVEKFV